MHLFALSENNIDRTVRNIQSAWNSMVSRNLLYREQIRPIIAESWGRCLKQGVSFEKQQAPVPMNKAMLDARRTNSAKLLEISQPVLEQLYKWNKGLGFLVALSDTEGLLLEVLGDSDVLEQASRNNFVIGADWSEEGAGTNAVGTCVTTKQPIQVLAAEHFCVGWQDWTCSCAPIRDPFTGAILGTLDISGAINSVHAHNLSLVVSSATVIEQNLRQWQLYINQRNYNLLVDKDEEGLIIVDKAGKLSTCNSHVKNLLNDVSDAGVGDFLDLPIIQEKWQHVQMGSAVVEDEIKINGHWLKVSCVPIKYGNISTGTIIIIKDGYKRKTIGFESVKEPEEFIAKVSFASLKTKADNMKEVYKLAKVASRNQAHVLLLGESGTGKEVLARVIHNEGTQRGPFIPLNCGAISKELLESELFGYVQGAFTGASKKGKKGKFELAAGGTLFLDEIGEMPLDMQVALLRVLEEKNIYPVGGEKPIPICCRIIAATQKDLFKEVNEGNFRADLFYRLNILTIDIPPLRERKSDILMLAELFLKSLQRNPEALDPKINDFFLKYSWPGNVRQLKNVLERLVYLSQGSRMKPEMLPKEVLQEYSQSPCGNSHEGEQEKDLILNALKESDYNRSKAAETLAISRSTLYRKLKKYRLS
ncbi:sigma-54-dependent Fis family transcriptional regulator [Metallumcola ferriviriculae]|uniref:Sigma-54-dependent Fis family transcriptional regulator n=1 Tax=Metallumcola ferriviriculae TaxID=3039180 RepID=A0AAU0UKP5_9FIRM|nr:sigma-54-dependent Fis family transcriptional regulator [Desulfitibacteraceae bacterium MK1]